MRVRIGNHGYFVSLKVIYRSVITRGAGTILYVWGPTNQNKCCGKSGVGHQYMGGPPIF